MKLNNYKEKLMVFGGLVGIGAISLAITLAVYNVQLSNETEIEDEKDTNIVLNQGLTEAQKIVAQNLIAELEKIEKQDGDSVVDETENEKLDSTSNVTVNENVDRAENIIEVSSKVKNISFIKPLDGDISMGFSNSDLVYLKTLDEWGIHTGVDILAEVGSEVVASADGVVRCVYEDVMYGFTIVLEHDDGYVTRYSGVSEYDVAEVGDEVKQGEVIAKVAESSGFEMEEESHLHFEVVKDGVSIEPKF